MMGGTEAAQVMELVISPRQALRGNAEQSVAPDRAAILVLRDTTPLQAARQVNAVVR